MKKKYDIIVYIGRFQPFTNAHYQIVKKALSLSKKVIIFIGSADRSRSFRNPWKAFEREAMISSINEFKNKNIVYIHQRNSNYDLQWWIKEIKKKVKENSQKDDKIGIIGFEKDFSSYYLKLFPKWDLINIPELENGLSATDIRIDFFKYSSDYVKYIPPEVNRYLKYWKEALPHINLYLVQEFESIIKYWDSWKGSPYPPTFITADALCICDNKILLVKRKNHPGMNLLAMPGGYLNSKESILDCCIRELKEETNINISIDKLKKSIVFNRYFDEPSRDPRGRSVTHCFMIYLKNQKTPKIIASDDAKSVQWMSLDEIDDYRDDFFDDHYQIIKNMLKQINNNGRNKEI